jgi:ATP phosphoribosyltransferase
MDVDPHTAIQYNITELPAGLHGLGRILCSLYLFYLISPEFIALKLKIGLPKGSLQDATFDLFRKAGFSFRVDSSRSYVPTCDDPEIDALLIRPQEIPRYVLQGVLDCGLTGWDWIVDNDAADDLIQVADLVYGKREFHTIKIVLAAPNDSPINEPKDLQGKRIATEYVNLTRRWLAQHGVDADVEFSWGACEVKVPDLADAIVANTETGSSLRAHGLRIVQVILESSTRFVMNKESYQDPWKRAKAENIAMLLQGALNAIGMVGLKMNVCRDDLPKVLDILPALKRPTISNLADENWVALEVILEERAARDLVPQLKRAGATGLVEYPLNKVIY